MLKNAVDKYGWLIAVIVTAVAIWPTLNNGWVSWDDTAIIKNGTLIQDLSANGIGRMLTEPLLANYHPITTLSLALDYAIGGEDPKVYHVINFILHLFNVVLVFVFIKALFKEQRIAFFAALLFGVHPMHLESVALIAQRKDLLYTAFYLLSMTTYVRYVNRNDSAKKQWYFLSLALFLLSLLSKSMAVSLPLVLLLIDVLKGRGIIKETLLEKVPFAFFSIVFAALAIYTQSDAGALNTPSGFNSLIVASFGVLVYTFKLVAPIHLSAYHPYPEIFNWSFPWYYYLTIVFPVILVGVGYYYRKKSKEVLFGILFFLITILPVIQLIPIGSALHAERYTYVPYIGLFLSVYFILKHYASQKVVFLAITVFAVTMTFTTFQRSSVWANPRTLWTDVIQKYPNDFFGYWSRGNSYLEGRNWKAALEDYKEAQKFNPKFSSINMNMGVAYLSLGNVDEAFKQYNTAIKKNPKSVSALMNRGMIYFDMDMWTSAMYDFNAVLEIDPANASALTHRAVLHKRMGNYEEAIRDNSVVISVNPNSPGIYYNRGFVYYLSDEKELALNDFSKAINLDHKHAAAHYWRSICSLDLGDTVAAKQDLLISMELGHQADEEYLRVFGLN